MEAPKVIFIAKGIELVKGSKEECWCDVWSEEPDSKEDIKYYHEDTVKELEQENKVLSKKWMDIVNENKEQSDRIKVLEEENYVLKGEFQRMRPTPKSNYRKGWQN